MGATLTLTTMLQELSERCPQACALVERSADRNLSLTYQELWERSRGTAAQLREHGVRRGDVVGVWLPNWIESVVLEFAVAALGAGALGINTRYGVHELSHLLRTGPPVGIVMPDAFHDLDFTGRLRQATADARAAQPDLDIPWVATVVNTARTEHSAKSTHGPDLGSGWWQLDVGLAVSCRGDGTDSIEAGQPGDEVNYFTTSGSTGLPKVAGHHQSAVFTHARHTAAALDMRQGDVFLSALPLSGVFGFNPTMAMLSVGGTCLLEPTFEAARVLRDLEEFGVTHVVGGDDLLGRLMDAWHEERRVLTSLRRGGIADFAGRAPQIILWAAEHLGAEISGLYGSSELFSLTAIWPPGRSVEDRSRGGGRVVSPDIHVRAVDAKGQIVGRGQTGELQFSGYNVLTCYLGDVGHPESFTSDGWFRSGDLGHLTDSPGEFVYACRAGDALRLRGFLVEPAEIERFLMTHPAVAQAKVIGVTDAAGQDLAVAYVTSAGAPPPEVDDLLAYCRGQLAPFKVPSLLRVIEKFPTTTGTNGVKIRTAELRQWATSYLSAITDEGGTRDAPA